MPPLPSEKSGALKPYWSTADQHTVVIYHGDCNEVMAKMPASSVDAIATDPPYGLEFMGKEWDKLGAVHEHPIDGEGPWGRIEPVRYGKSSGGEVMQAWHQQWATVALRVIKPGGYMLVMGGTRTYHRLACAVEDAGWEVRDCLMYLYASGFPKSKGCLKPAYEPVLLCRKPGPRVIPLQIDECRIGVEHRHNPSRSSTEATVALGGGWVESEGRPAVGRWPANIIHDGSDEVLEEFARYGESKPKSARTGFRGGTAVFGQKGIGSPTEIGTWPNDEGGTAARFFYTAKPSRAEREYHNNHPTVKPVALMEYLVKLICPKGGLVLDPFLGSGTTAMGAVKCGRRCIGIEREEQYLLDGAIPRITHSLPDKAGMEGVGKERAVEPVVVQPVDLD